MAGHDDGERVAPVRGADRAEGARVAEGGGERGVGRRGPVRNGRDRIPDAALEGGAAWRQRQIEALELAVEIGAELLLCGSRQRVAGARGGRPMEVDRDESVRAGSEPQRADRRLDTVHADDASGATGDSNRHVRKPLAARATMVS